MFSSQKVSSGVGDGEGGGDGCGVTGEGGEDGDCEVSDGEGNIVVATTRVLEKKSSIVVLVTDSTGSEELRVVVSVGVGVRVSVGNTVVVSGKIIIVSVGVTAGDVNRGVSKAERELIVREGVISKLGIVVTVEKSDDGVGTGRGVELSGKNMLLEDTLI